MHHTYAAAREKRSLDPGSNQDCEPDRKRPALASVIVEALKVDSLQKLCSSLEPVLRKVVSEEVERALAKLGPAKLNGRVSPKRIEAPNGRNLQLQFKSKLSLPLFTGGKIEGEHGAAIHVVLFDANTGQIVSSGPESSLKLDVVVLEGDFNNEDDEGWTEEEFESHTVKEREGKRPILTGDLQVVLRNGLGTLGDLSFTDNSSWIRSRKFRLGLKVASGNPEGFRIREAKTEAFPVRDHRGELYKKHYPPAPNDEVWRLEKIGKDGSFHKRLESAGIRTVEDFLRLVMKDQQKLRRIMGTGMSNKMWEVLVEHAKTCVLSGKHYIYYSDETRHVGAIFNDSYVLIGLIFGGQYHSVESLDTQKEYVDALVKKAYENWNHVIEYDGKSLLGFDQNKSTDASHNLSNTFEQLTLPSLPVPNPTQHQPMNPGLEIPGFNENMGGNRYPVQLQNMNFQSAAELPGTSFPPQNLNFHSHSIQQTQVPGSENLLALGPPLPTMQSFPTANNNTSNFTYNRGGFDDNINIPVDEIRARSHEMIESDDIQQLLRMYSMGGGIGHSSFNANENFGFTPYTTPFSPPNFNLDDERTRPPSGKAVVSWLKLKAVLRWGIFVRNKAAEKRARIEDLDE